MKRFACLCGGLAVLVAAQSAKAQVVATNAGLSVWYDVRPTINEITVAPVAPYTRGQSLFSAVFGKGNFVENVIAGNSGGPGDGQVLRISPRLPLDPGGSGFGSHVTGNAKKGFKDNSVANLYAFITVEANGAGTEQVISALGRDTDVTKLGGAGAGNKIEDITVTPDTANWSAGGTTASAAPAGDDWAMTAKSVKIPVVAGPMYDATGGAIPTGVYRVACIRVTASTWNKGSAKPGDSTFEGHDKVNNLLMTRAVKTGGPVPAEVPDFGYTLVNLGDVLGADGLPGSDGRDDFATGSNGGIPEANSGGDGLTIGTTSVESDFDIIVQMKGDFNDDGAVSAADIPAFNAATAASLAGTIRQRGIYLGDFTNDGLVNAGDIPAFNNATAASFGDCTTSPGVDCLPSGLPLPSCPAP